MAIDSVALTAAILLLASIAATAGAVASFVRSDSVIARRLKLHRAVPDSGKPPADVLAQVLDPFARLAQPSSIEDASRVKLQLVRAGLRKEHAVKVFLASKVILATCLALALLWFHAQYPAAGQPRLLLALTLFAAGYYAPNIWLAGRIKARIASIERGLPDALDLLVTCVEAGLGLDAALQRVAAETKLAWRTLGEELELTSLEAKAGIPRVEGFRRLADRTGVTELKSLAATLAQTELFGTSIGAALRIQAEGIRTRRMQRAEERAAYVSVKMALPMAFCILPSLFAVILGPAAVRVMHALGPILTRGGR